MTWNDFKARMSAIVGDTNTVARYLVEKQGHTSLIAWVTGCICLSFVVVQGAASVGLVLLAAGLAATTIYDLVGKIVWFRGHTLASWAAEVRDAFFDWWVGAFVCVWPTVFFVPWGPLAALAAWAVVFWLVDSWGWGSPG